MLDSLLSPTVRAVVIKGLPGAGKTTLAIELLKKAGGGLYVSTRVSEAKLVEQHPHVKPLVAAGVEAHALRVEDLRLGTASEVVAMVLEAVHREKRPLVVLDSWDAMARELDGKERLRVEKSLVAAVEASESRIVFVSEEPNLTTSDYLADAVVALSDVDVEGRRCRVMEWVKIRGVAIPQKRYLFTLADGRFTLLKSGVSEPPRCVIAGAYKPTPHTDTQFSTGSKDLDTFFGGGLRRGLCILLEVGKTVGLEYFIPLVTSIGCNFLAQRGCCVFIPAGGVTPEMVKKGISPYVEEDVVKSGLRVGHFEKTKEDPSFFRFDAHSVEECFRALWSKIDEVKGREARPCIISIGIDTIEYTYGPEGLVKQIVAAINRVRTQMDALILEVKAGSAVKQQLSDLSDLHIKLNELEGSLVIYSTKPPSPIHSLNYDYSEGYPKATLTPIL